jgi:ferredoxin-NADP reductase
MRWKSLLPHVVRTSTLPWGRDVARNVSLRSVFPDLKNSDLYVCGPQAWTDAVIADAKANGLPDHQIHAERFDW